MPITDHHVEAQKAAADRFRADARYAQQLGHARAAEVADRVAATLDENLEVVRWARRLQQNHARRTAGRARVEADGVTVDPATKTVRYRDATITSGHVQFAVAYALVAEPNRAWTYPELHRRAYGRGAHNQEALRSVRDAVQRFRTSLREAGCDHLIHNVWGAGYQLRAPDSNRDVASAAAGVAA